MSDPKSPSLPKSHPQAQALGKNKFNKKNPPAPPPEPASPGPASPGPASPGPVAPSPAPTTPKPPGRNSPAPFGTGLASGAAPAPAPGKDLKRFEITVSINGSDEPPFTVDVPLTGNGPADQAAARALAKKRHPGAAMTVISSRIFTITENALTEIAPGSTLSSLFGATGGVTEDLIEVGRAFYDGSRGAIFLRNMRSHVGLTFRPSTGGLVVFSNRIVSNRLASELPLIVAEVLGNNSREVEIYLKP